MHFESASTTQKYMIVPTCVLLLHGLEAVYKLGATASADDEQPCCQGVQGACMADLLQASGAVRVRVCVRVCVGMGACLCLCLCLACVVLCRAVLCCAQPCVAADIDAVLRYDLVMFFAVRQCCMLWNHGVCA